MSDFCPYLGTWRDESLPFTEPDHGNRCYARHKMVRVFWFFYKKMAGAWVEIEHQRSACYGDYRKCPDYKKKPADSEPEQAPREPEEQ